MIIRLTTRHPRTVSDDGKIDLNPPRPQNRRTITRAMMNALLRLAKFRGGVMPQTAKLRRFNLHPRTVAALYDAGLAVDYVVAIDWPDGTQERTPKVAITWWGRMLVDAYRFGKGGRRW